MKKILILLYLLAFCLYCGPKQDVVERIVEDGVEVVINHLELYRLKGEPSSLEIEELMRLDFEEAYYSEIGLTNTMSFDVDSRGNIYFLSDEPEEHWIYKFDAKGNFIKSFFRFGQGPGEVRFPRYGGIDSNNNVVISDHVNRKVVVFDSSGTFLNEYSYPQGMYAMYPLENGNFIAFWQFRDEPDPNAEYRTHGFSLYNERFEEIKILDTYKHPNPLKYGRRATNLNPVFFWRISYDRIFIGNENRDYEFLVFDFNGNLIRKIRKEYTPIEFPEDLKQDRLERSSGRFKIFFPKYWTPFLSFFVDDENRLYVRTYEDGENPAEHIYDIFNSEGVLLLRKSLNIFTMGEISLSAVVKRNKLYCLQEKQNGFREFVVYKMIWE
jgi:hypothetical protein